MEKYQATILALRARVLAPRYRTTVEYEVGGDSASPAGIHAAFVFLILGFIGVVAYTGWKIKLFRRRIIDDKVQMETEKEQLVGYQEEVIRLRRLKLIQASIEEEKAKAVAAESGEDREFKLLNSFLGGGRKAPGKPMPEPI